MTGILFLVPVIASFVLGLFYVQESASPLRKAVVIVVFLGAAYLQFFSPYELAGVIIQVILAMILELRRLYWDASMPVGRSHYGQND